MVPWSPDKADVATNPRPPSYRNLPPLQDLVYPLDDAYISLPETHPLPEETYLALPDGYPSPADYFFTNEWPPHYIWPPDSQDRAFYDHELLQTLLNLNATAGFNISLEIPFRRLPNISMTPTSGTKVFGPAYHQKLREVILGAMLILAVIGNLMAVLRILRKWDHRGRMTILSLNLTVADLLVTHLTILGQLMWEVLDKQWYLSNGACKIYKVAQTFSITASNYLVVVIALDRHEAVLRPLSRFVSAQNLALSAWAVSLLPSLPNVFIFFRFEAPGGAVYCLSKFYTNDLDKDFRQVYLVLVLFLVFVVPLVLLLVLYVRICVTLWRQSKYFRSGKRDCNEGRRTNSLLPRARTKALGMTVAIVVVFLVTNLPYVLQELIVSFGDSKNLNPNIVALFGIASASNSCFNPYIFLFFASKDKTLASESYRVTFSKKIPPVTHAHSLPITSSAMATTTAPY